MHLTESTQNLIVEDYKPKGIIKPRISYGVNGNVNSLGYFATSQVYNNAGTYNGLGGTYVGSYVNSDVRWERTNSFNLGADLGILNDRIFLNNPYTP